MKKKLLLVLSMIALLVCLFVISVSAVEVDGIYYEIKGSGEDAYAVVSTENRASCTLETVEIPATITVEGVTYKVTKIDQNAFGQVSGDVNGNIKHLIIGANVAYVEQHAFRRVASLQTVVIKNTDAEKAIDFYNAQFMYCTGLKSVDAKDAKISSYGGNCFDGCSNLETVDYPSMLTTIGSRAFTDCVKLTSGDLSNTNVTKISSWAYGSCKSLTEIKFPNTLVEIGNNNFLYCPIETYVFPHSMKTFGKDMLAHQSKIKVVIMPEADENTKGVNNFLYSTRPNVIIYSGDNVEYFVTLHSAFANYDVKPFDQYVPGTTYAKNTIFYGKGKTCGECNGILENAESFKYTDLITEMKVSKGCTHCDAETVSERYAPVFVNLGYSTFTLNGYCSVVQGFKVNYESVEAYNAQFADKTITTFGVLAVAQSKVEGVAFDSEGNPIEGVINAEIENELSYFEIKVVKIPAEGALDSGVNYVDAMLHLCAYANVGNEVYYISENYVGTTLGEAVSYNSLQK